MATADEKLLYTLDATMRAFMDTMGRDHKDLRTSVEKIFGVVDDIRTVQAVFAPQIERLKDFGERLEEQERASDERGATLVRTITRVEKIDGDLSRMGAKVDILMTRTEPKDEPAPKPKRLFGAKVAGGIFAASLYGAWQFWDGIREALAWVKHGH